MESIFSDECTAAGSAFDLPPCNCLGAAKPAAFDDRPVISIVLGDFLSAAVDARLLKTVVEEILGFPARLVSYAGDYHSTWAALASGEAHIWPEVWRTEEDGEYYTEYVIRRRSVGTAGALGIIGRNGCADFAQPVWHGTVLGVRASATSVFDRWYTQDADVEKWPALAGWRGLRDAAIADYVGNELVAYDAGWGPTTLIMQKLNVAVAVKYYGVDADAHIAQRLAEELPTLFFLWSPHPFLEKYSLNRVSLPEMTNLGQYASGYTDYPPDILEKVFALELGTVAPLVLEMYTRFQLTVRPPARPSLPPARDQTSICAAFCCCFNVRRNRRCRTSSSRKSWLPCLTTADRSSRACAHG